MGGGRRRRTLALILLKISGATVQHSVTWMTRHLVFVHSSNKKRLSCPCACHKSIQEKWFIAPLILTLSTRWG